MSLRSSAMALIDGLRSRQMAECEKNLAERKLRKAVDRLAIIFGP